MLKKILLTACCLTLIIPLYSMEIPDDPIKAIERAIEEKNIKELITLTEFNNYLAQHDEKGTLYEDQYLAFLRGFGLGKNIDIENDIYHPIMAFIGINYEIYNPSKEIVGNYLRHITYDFLQDWSLIKKERLLKYINVLPCEEFNQRDLETENTLLHDILLWAQSPRNLDTINLFQAQTFTRHEATVSQIKPIIEELLKCGANPYLRNRKNISGVELLEIYGEESDLFLRKYCEGKGYPQDPDLSHLENMDGELNNVSLANNEEEHDRSKESLLISIDRTLTHSTIATETESNVPGTDRVDSAKNPVTFTIITAMALFAAAFVYVGYKIFYSSHNKFVKHN